MEKNSIGWQKQPNKLNIQGNIEKAIQTVKFSLDKTGGKIISEAELQERTKSYATFCV